MVRSKTEGRGWKQNGGSRRRPLWRKGVKMDTEEIEINFEQFVDLEFGEMERWIGK